jgi:hypothetical protein
LTRKKQTLTDELLDLWNALPSTVEDVAPRELELRALLRGVRAEQLAEEEAACERVSEELDAELKLWQDQNPFMVLEAEEKDVKSRSYDKEVFFIACPDQDDLHVKYNVAWLIAQATRGFYIGSTQAVVRRWEGAQMRNEKWMVGHRYAWLGLEPWEAKSPEEVKMTIVAVRRGEAGGMLETMLLETYRQDYAKPRIPTCTNKTTDARGTCRHPDCLNFTYVVRW